jgi:hypothetical protein
VRSRWQEWTIAGSIVAILATGVVTIWWQELHSLFGAHGEDEAAKKPAEVTAPAPPPGPAQGPF